MVHGHLLVETRVERSRSESHGECFLTELIAPDDGSSGLRLIEGDHLFPHAGKGHKGEQAYRKY